MELKTICVCLTNKPNFKKSLEEIQLKYNCISQQQTIGYLLFELYINSKNKNKAIDVFKEFNLNLKKIKELLY